MIDLSMQDCADTAHVFMGITFVLLPVVWGWHHAQLWGSGLGIAFSAFKEFVFDLEYETLETSGGIPGGWRDFFGYAAGIVLANILVIF